MGCNMLLLWALLLISVGPMLAHPILDTAEMTYSDSAEEAGGVSPEELTVSDVSSLLQRASGQSYSPLLFREGLRATGLLPKEALKEVLLEKPGHLASISHLLGVKRPYRKRGSGADCFWKYCV